MSSKKKLTLSVDEQVIERARRYSRDHGTSISQLVTTYLRALDPPFRSRVLPPRPSAARDPAQRHLCPGVPASPRGKALLMRLFFDINVILDVLADREPWFHDSAAVLSLVDRQNVEGFLAAHSVTTLMYLTTKEIGRQRAVAALLDLLDHFTVTPLDQDLLLRALSLGWDDVEDAVQAISAQRVRANHLVTRNSSDFPSLTPAMVTPTELVAIVQSSRS